MGVYLDGNGNAQCTECGATAPKEGNIYPIQWALLHRCPDKICCQDCPHKGRKQKVGAK